ncbi:DNA glycosylase [Meira miltonrushii]|uniref:DNA glycosylase n=1 Tax=Meira miltonrushii TaxID=1280837 RepID=A0A316V9N4_9BASI|nr:DNA glycosylase [Meira miltonrushii]PWN33758.1 DNA glycosylase [Meira miltonrushii]
MTLTPYRSSRFASIHKRFWMLAIINTRTISLLLLRRIRITEMVTLRTRQAKHHNETVIPPKPEESIAKNFVRQKSTVASQVNGTKRTKVENGTETIAIATSVAETPSPKKRKATPKKESGKPATAHVAEEEQLPLLSRDEVSKATTIDYPRLPFDLDEAVSHLRSVDSRFDTMLEQIELKPYQELVDGRVRELDLFRTLATSILGQQVSWLAARVIVYRFVRLFHTELPEKPDFDAIPRDSLPFPHPIDVCQSDDAFLRTAGLSGAKVKYVKDVARRFSDGRLDARKIITLNEEDCIAELVQIKGVGRWTAEMLLMFALRRGNILPVGDLGVQRGMVIFFTSNSNQLKIEEKKRKQKQAKKEDVHDSQEKVTVIEDHLTESQAQVEREIPNIDNIKDEHETGPHFSAPPTNGHTSYKIPPLPEGISPSLLKTRREGKKAKGNVYLTPPEMEALAAEWAPFRSIAVYMMWALVD